MADFSKVIESATSNPSITVGDKIPIGNSLIMGNYPKLLSMLMVDSAGRIWAECHGDNLGSGELVCILDLRDLAHAIDARPK